jgi:hypothetical protein
MHSRGRAQRRQPSEDSDNAPDFDARFSAVERQPTATPSKSSAAFPQGQAAFPNASTPKPGVLERFLNEIGGPKPAY